MEGQLNLDCERFQQITQMAKMGWWESDVKNQQYICSDFIVDLLGLESHRISFLEFLSFISSQEMPICSNISIALDARRPLANAMVRYLMLLYLLLYPICFYAFWIFYKISLTPYADTGVSSTFPVSMSKAVTVFPVSFRQRMVRRPLFFAIPL